MRPHVLILVGLVATAPADAYAEQGRARGQQRAERRDTMRFRAMDTNNDGIVTRAEWRGSDRSFTVHDWNGDGRLSGEEVRVGAVRRRNADDDYNRTRSREFDDWSSEGFTALDHNRDNRLTRDEWHYGAAAFRRADRNGDNILSRDEFVDANVDIDREDEFENLDANNNGRIERAEWHGSRDAFDWLDRNNDGVLTRLEVVGEESTSSQSSSQDLFASLDYNRDNRITVDEWHWSRRSFNQQDVDRDGALTRSELTDAEVAAANPGAATSGQRTVMVDANQRWTDTGIDIRANDVVTIQADGIVRLSLNGQDDAGPAGAGSGRRAENAPMRERPAGALIARVGEANPMFVGARGTLNPSSTGRLVLGVNDDHLLDNGGQFRVTISVQRR